MKGIKFFEKKLGQFKTLVLIKGIGLCNEGSVEGSMYVTPTKYEGTKLIQRGRVYRPGQYFVIARSWIDLSYFLSLNKLLMETYGISSKMELPGVISISDKNLSVSAEVPEECVDYLLHRTKRKNHESRR